MIKRIALAFILAAIISAPAEARKRGHKKIHTANYSETTNSWAFDKHAAIHPSYAPVYREHYRQRVNPVPVHKTRVVNKRYKLKEWVKQPSTETAQWGSSSGLVATARAYMGTNPTGWSRVWCGRFMAMIAPEAARRVSNPNMARSWAGLPRVAGCQVGAIAVLARGRRGGHVGVVSDCTERGPRIVSGNHNRRVGEAVYPAGRVLAYVSG